MESNQTELKTEERLPWHKPEIERLHVGLDTRDGAGSSQDSYVFTGGN